MSSKSERNLILFIMLHDQNTKCFTLEANIRNLKIRQQII
jgi:hypothetical protein